MAKYLEKVAKHQSGQGERRNIHITEAHLIANLISTNEHQAELCNQVGKAENKCYSLFSACSNSSITIRSSFVHLFYYI